MKSMKVGPVIGFALLLASCNQEPLPDATAPTIVLEATPTTLTTSGTVILKATASDDRGVARVSFYRGDTLLSTDGSAPFEAVDALAVQAGGQVSYRAVAEDAAGNRAEAKQDVTLTVGEIVGTVVEGVTQFGADGTPSVALKSWTGGGGTVKLTLSGTQEGATTVETALAADGSFRLGLPTPGAGELQLFSTASCPNGVTVSDQQAKGTYGFLAVYANKIGTISPFKLLEVSASGATVEAGALIYVDRPVTLNGTDTCSFFKTNFNALKLLTGWNKVQVIEQDGSNGSRTFTYSNAPFLDNWVYLSGPSGSAAPSAQSLNAASRSLFR